MTDRLFRLAAYLLVVLGFTALTGDPGILVTGIAAAGVLEFGRGIWLRHLLAIYWAMAAGEAWAVVAMPTVVFSYATMDLVIALASLGRMLDDHRRTDAKLVGLISLALMPAHFAVSAAHGGVNWTLYALGCNVAFVLQCSIIGGWLDGVGRIINRFVLRLHPARLFRDRGR